jgi:hypothetical protein
MSPTPGAEADSSTPDWSGRETMNSDHVRAAWVVLVIASHGATACHVEERDPCVVEPCDISRGACQREVFEAIACARDYDGASPPVEVISFSEYQSRNDESALTLRDLQVANAFVTLGFAPTIGSLTESYGNPIAYYSPQAGRVTVVESDDDDDIRIFVLLQAFANAQRMRLHVVARELHHGATKSTA